MASQIELQRLAAAINQLRPDWPTTSIQTYLQTHANRAYPDLAVAAIAVAVDPTSRTPRRMDEAGPWWQLVNQTVTGQVGPGREPACTLPGHEHELDRHCRACAADRLAPQENDPPEVTRRNPRRSPS